MLLIPRIVPKTSEVSIADSSLFIQGVSLSLDSLLAAILFLLAVSTTPLESRPSESPFL